MAASRVDFAHVYLAQATCVCTEYPIRLRHCGVALPCMSDVEAKHRLGKFFENKLKLFQRPANRLSTVHIFDGELLPEAPPDGKVMDRVGMKNDGPIARHKSPQEVDDLHFLAGVEAARRISPQARS